MIFSKKVLPRLSRRKPVDNSISKVGRAGDGSLLGMYRIDCSADNDQLKCFNQTLEALSREFFDFGDLHTA